MTKFNTYKRINDTKLFWDRYFGMCEVDELS